MPSIFDDTSLFQKILTKNKFHIKVRFKFKIITCCITYNLVSMYQFNLTVFVLFGSSRKGTLYITVVSLASERTLCFKLLDWYTLNAASEVFLLREPCITSGVSSTLDFVSA